MNNTIRNKIRYSNTYTKICYQTKYSHGEIILKDEVLKAKPNFHKLFRDSDYEVIQNYRVTMMDIIKSALRTLHYQFYIYEWKLKNERKRSYVSEKNENEYIDKMKYYHTRIVRLERKTGRYAIN